MLQVTVPDGVVEGGQFQANTPSGPVLDTVPPGVKSGQVIQISAPGPMVMERTERSDASNAMVGTWTLVPSGSCSSCSCCGGASADMVITESNQVQTIYCENSHRCCGWIRASKGSGSRGVSDTSITINQTSTQNDVTQIITTCTITSATRDTIEMEWDQWTKRSIYPDIRTHGTMSWDLADKTMKLKGRAASIPFASVTNFIKTA
jgi:hypothetical protein